MGSMVHLSAQADHTGCTNGYTSLHFQIQLPGSTQFVPNNGQGDTYSKTLDFEISREGTYYYRARFACPPPSGPYPIEAYSETRQFNAVTELSGTPSPELVASCERRRKLIDDMAALNDSLRDEMIPEVQRAQVIAKFGGEASKIAAAVVAANEEIPGAPVYAGAFNAISKAYAGAGLWGKAVELDMRRTLGHWEKVVAEERRQYKSDCKGITATAGTMFEAASSRTLPTPLATTAAADASVAALRRNTASLGKRAAKWKAAAGTLARHLDSTGGPRSDIAAVRQHSRKAIGLFKNDIRLRKALANADVLGRLRLRARDVPRSLRRKEGFRNFIGEPLAAIVAGDYALRADRLLIAILRKEPFVP